MGGWRWLGLLALVGSLWLAACGSGSSGFDANPVGPTDSNVPPEGGGGNAQTFHTLLACTNPGQHCTSGHTTAALQVATDPEVTEGGVCEPQADDCRLPIGVFLQNLPAGATVRLAARLPEAAAPWQLNPLPLPVSHAPVMHLEDTITLRLPRLFVGEVVVVDIAVLVWLGPPPAIPLSFTSLPESRADYVWHELWQVQVGF